MTEPVPVWQEPVSGFRYAADVVCVTRAHQREKLEACGLEPATFGDDVDPAFFIGLAIHAGIRSGISAQGNVNMLQSLVQLRPARLGEPLRVEGLITAITPVPRGRTIDTDVGFADTAGIRVIGARRRSLQPDPAAPANRGAGERPEPVIDDLARVRPLREYRLTPDRVRAYSMEGNSIHYELVAAQKAGFRAPIIGGGMGVHYLLAELWWRFRPASLDLDIYFRRPIFWDDAFTVGCRGDEAAWDAMCLYKDGKVATEIRINRALSAGQAPGSVDA